MVSIGQPWESVERCVQHDVILQGELIASGRSLSLSLSLFLSLSPTLPLQLQLDAALLHGAAAGPGENSNEEL